MSMILLLCESRLRTGKTQAAAKGKPRAQSFPISQSPGRCQRKTTSTKFPRFVKPRSLPRKSPGKREPSSRRQACGPRRASEGRAVLLPGGERPAPTEPAGENRDVKVLCFSLSREKKNSRPQGAAVFFKVAVSQHTDTRPVWASRVTTAPLFKRSVACSAPVMTGLSMARPAIAAWELAPDSSVMIPEARRR